jgi:putative component of membrane protein insertase Oxa1/YidC/SpoIIIJ protein YidD
MIIEDTLSTGFTSFVKEIARMVACNSRWHAGFDTSCNNEFIYIPGCGQYAFEENICSRQSVRGRRTRVDLVRKLDEETKTNTEQQGMDVESQFSC